MCVLQQRTADEMRSRDGSSDVCSSDLAVFIPNARKPRKEDAEAAAERDEAPGWGRPPEQPAAWHETLGVDADASHEEIVAAYRRLIAPYHPARVATMAPEFRQLAETRSAPTTAPHHHDLPTPPPR